MIEIPGEAISLAAQRATLAALRGVGSYLYYYDQIFLTFLQQTEVLTVLTALHQTIDRVRE